MVIFPGAKINIGLKIIGKRPDGFHNLETIFYPVGLCDALEYIVGDKLSEKDTLTVSGLLSSCRPEDNLVSKSVLVLREKKEFPFLNINLLKAIPAGAGLGGGSSDAANMLVSLNRYFNLKIGTEELKKIALTLGSDCPFFIDGLPAYAEGRGEILSPVKPLLSGYHILLVNPGIPVNTKEAFREYLPGNSKDHDLKKYYSQNISEWKRFIINDFEKSIFLKYPLIAYMKEELYRMGAVYSSLSGSGSTVYGIFPVIPVIADSLRRHVIFSGVL